MQAKQTLAEAKDGQNLTVVAFDNDEVVVQALRFGIASECGWGRGDPARVPDLIAAHRAAAEGLAF